MFDYIENLKILSSFKHESKLYGKITSRAAHGFIFRIGGVAEYVIDGIPLSVRAGEMIYLPQGAAYEYRTSGGEENLYTSINFTADMEATPPSVYPMENFYRLNYIYDSFSEMWRFGSASDKHACISVFYDLISYVAKIEHLGEAESGKYGLIEPAVEYMRKHIYEPSFRIEALHSRCGISDTYFRKIFKLRFGLAPKEYVISERISHAKSIIESGDYDSISEVAESVGFSDPLYFSKAFKRAYGICPSGIIG